METDMNEINKNIADEINRLHQLATQSANEAMEYAKSVGLLLIQKKSELPHGEYGKWVDANLLVTMRQAQRYVNVAEGKELPVRALSSKYDTVSHLEGDSDENKVVIESKVSDAEFDSIMQEYWNPEWIPKTGHWHIGVTDEGAYWVVPDIKNPNSFHITRFYSSPECQLLEEDGDLYDATRWAEDAVHVEFRLKRLSLSHPNKVEWKVRKKAGLSKPFGTPENYGRIMVIGKDGQEKWIPDAF
jgi:hypothetical protein